MLKAALDSKVRRVVVTSSALTIYNFLEETDKNYTFSEKDRVPAEKAGMAYQKSKILAEKAAWDFYEQHKRSGKCFELITIHPGFVMGPQQSFIVTHMFTTDRIRLCSNYFFVVRRYKL